MDQFFYYLIPVFIALTTIALCVGLFAMIRGGQYAGNFSNKMMQRRILFQFLAIVAAMAFLYASGRVSF